MIPSDHPAPLLALRDPVFPSADGKFVYTINSQSGNIGIFAINHQDGTLTSLGQVGDLPKSVGFNGIAAL